MSKPLLNFRPKPEIAEIAATVPGVSRVIVDGQHPGEIDFILPLLSSLTKLNLVIPNTAPYIRIQQIWNNSPAGQSIKKKSGKLNVGIVWAGDPAHGGDKRRSIPLKLLLPILEVPGINFYALQ